MIFILSCLCGILAYEAVYVLVNFLKGKRKSAMISHLPEGLVSGFAIGSGLWVREQLGEDGHPFLAFILVMIVIFIAGKLLISYISKKLNSR